MERYAEDRVSQGTHFEFTQRGEDLEFRDWRLTADQAGLLPPAIRGGGPAPEVCGLAIYTCTNKTTETPVQPAVNCIRTVLEARYIMLGEEGAVV